MNLKAMISVFAIIIALWFVVHAYLAVRLMRPARGWRRTSYFLFVVTLAALPPLVMWSDRTGRSYPLQDVVRWIGFAGMALSTWLAFWFLCEDAVRIPAWFASRFRGRPPAPASAVDADRRRFLRNTVNLGVVGAAGGLTAVQARAANDVPAVREVEIPLPNLPAAFDGFRIAQISDLHVGATIRRSYVEDVVRATSALGADLIAVTGDLVDGPVAEFRHDVAPLRDLAAPEGVFFVTGNHEYFWDPLGWLDELRTFGWRVLLNEHHIIERGDARILLAGVTDYSSRRRLAAHVSDPAAARAGAPATDASILLAHQPRSIFAASQAGYDLQISGHTHGGQYFPISLLIHLFEPYVAGLNRHDSTWIYVNRGTGYWGPPARLGVPKEITLLRLRRG